MELKQLEAGLVALDLTATVEQKQQFLTFIHLLQKWQKAFNLTAVSGENALVRRHLLDSLSIAAYVEGERILDVGTGAGLPGLPLSILQPQRHFFLLDSNHKKQVFVEQSIKLLGLKNATAVHARVETYQPAEKFSTILTRAFAPLPQVLRLSEHLLAENGRWVAMLGKVEEPLGVGAQAKVEALISLKVPQEKAQRHVAVITKGAGLL